jgi:hypothetical protein
MMAAMAWSSVWRQLLFCGRRDGVHGVPSGQHEPGGRVHLPVQPGLWAGRLGRHPDLHTYARAGRVQRVNVTDWRRRVV